MTDRCVPALHIPDPTFALLLAGLRWPSSDARRKAMLESISKGIDWERLLLLIVRHRVAPLVLHALQSEAIEIPRAIAEKISDWSQHAIFVELRASAQILSLMRCLEKAGVEAVLLKGLAQSLRYFGSLGLRTNRDIDLLVAPGDVLEAEHALTAAGYERIEPPVSITAVQCEQWLRNHKDMLFQSPSGGLPVELHWRLFDNPALMAFAGLPESTRICIPPLDNVLMLPDNTNLRYLCNHGALHAWSRLKWLADVNALLFRIDEKTLRNASRPDGGQDHAVGQALILCRDLLGAKIPADIGLDIDRSRRARLLARLAWWQIVRSDINEIEDSRFGSTLKNLSHYALNDSWHYRYEELRFDFAVPPRGNGMAASGRGGRIGDWLLRHVAGRRSNR